MVAVGERSGQLEAMLSKAADTYDDEVENAVVALTTILEPIIIVFMAASFCSSCGDPVADLRAESRRPLRRKCTRELPPPVGLRLGRDPHENQKLVSSVEEESRASHYRIRSRTGRQGHERPHQAEGCERQEAQGQRCQGQEAERCGGPGCRSRQVSTERRAVVEGVFIDFAPVRFAGRLGAPQMLRWASAPELNSVPRSAMVGPSQRWPAVGASYCCGSGLNRRQRLRPANGAAPRQARIAALALQNDPLPFLPPALRPPTLLGIVAGLEGL